MSSEFEFQPKQPLNQHHQSSYQSFTELGPDTIHSSPHLFIHVASGSKVTRPWQAYIGDLDDFFEQIYQYYQRSGFLCIVVDQILELIKIILVIFLTFFFLNCVDYDVLFKNRLPPGKSSAPLKVTIADCLIPIHEIQISSLQVVLLVFAISFWFIKLAIAIYSIITNNAIRIFFIEVLQIHDPTVYSWLEIQTRLIRAQSHCLLREGHLDELVIHNRLLRRANYTIALINKGVLPIYYRLPLFGELIYLSSGLQFNFDLLLFRGFFSLFEKNWKLRDEVKSASKRLECARHFANRCLVLGIINLLLLPLILVWQSLYAFYTYVEALKRNPSFASTRTWSRYGQWFCRHFNEMDHELEQRLNRAHRPATRYMDSFPSPLLELLAKFFRFTAGILLSVLIVLTVYDEDVITIEHLITVATVLGAIIAISQAFISDYDVKRWTLAELDSAVLQHIHYRPHGYPAHTAQAQKAMNNIFVYKSTTIIEELLSPIVTPYILIRHLRPRAIEIIDFFRVYTLELADIGDVCTFSQFNFHQHGHRIFNEASKKATSPAAAAAVATTGVSATSLGQRAEVLEDERHTTRNGKLELSLINFRLMNPTWQPQENSQLQFIDRFVRQSKDDPGSTVRMVAGGGGTNLANIESHSTIDYCSPSSSNILVDRGGGGGGDLPLTSTSQPQPPPGHFRSMLGRMDESEYGPQDDFGFENTRRRLLQKRFTSVFSEQEERDADMSLSSLYFHQLASDSHFDPRVGSIQVPTTAPIENQPVVSQSMLPSSSGSSQLPARSRKTNESMPLLHHDSLDR